MGTIIIYIYYYSEVNTESEIHFDTNDFDTFDTVSEKRIIGTGHLTQRIKCPVPDILLIHCGFAFQLLTKKEANHIG